MRKYVGIVILGLISFGLIYSSYSGSKARGTNDFIITINYELGMHCTGFDFEYCCVLPPYNSVQAQVIKVGSEDELPQLMDGYDPADPTVLVDKDTGKRYRLKYEFDNNSYSEGSKMTYWNAQYDIDRDGKSNEPGESVANAYWNHLYVYKDLEGSNPEGTSADSKKLPVGGSVLQVPVDAGPSGQGLSGYLRNSTEKGTVVFTKSPVLDNVPIVLTNPGIWEALGLPLTPFVDSEMAGNIKAVSEKNIQPYQVARVTLVDAETDEPIRDTKGKVVSYTGTEPIDVPNCNNCHGTMNANERFPEVWKRVQAEKEYWKKTGASDWYADLKGTAISILSIHDMKHGTMFTNHYNAKATSNRLGRDGVLCQKCHADNVIGVLNSAKVVHKTDGSIEVQDVSNSDLGLPDGTPIDHLDPNNPNTPKDGTMIPALTEALHFAHQTVRPLADASGRTGACQGCHPAHRQDRSLTNYPITADGKNTYANADNRDAAGGCYVGRDVHSNPNKDKDGVETPEHLNAIGQWLKKNVSRDKYGNIKGLWCTNCHNNITRELYKHDNLQPGKAFDPAPEHTLRDNSLEEIAAAIGMSVEELKANLDPKVTKNTDGEDTGATLNTWKSAAAGRTTPAIAVIATDGKNPVISKDGDNDINVKILDANPSHTGQFAAENGFAAPYEAATHGRDYWLSPGEPHCADCHSAPFTESQGGVAFPINQPGKYSLMRYSKGHSGLTCQTCHQSIHGLYPVTPNVDVTTYEQAAALNPDGSHGPLKCATCHGAVNENGVPIIAMAKLYKDQLIGEDYNLAVEYMHYIGKDEAGKGGEPVGMNEMKDSQN